MQVLTKDAMKDGSCNFCESNDLTVVELSGRGISVRLCRDCLKTVKGYKPEKVSNPVATEMRRMLHN